LRAALEQHYRETIQMPDDDDDEKEEEDNWKWNWGCRFRRGEWRR
jgi:hypothetical protein